MEAALRAKTGDGDKSANAKGRLQRKDGFGILL